MIRLPLPVPQFVGNENICSLISLIFSICIHMWKQMEPLGAHKQGPSWRPCMMAMLYLNCQRLLNTSCCESQGLWVCSCAQVLLIVFPWAFDWPWWEQRARLDGLLAWSKATLLMFICWLVENSQAIYHGSLSYAVVDKMPFGLCSSQPGPRG